MELKDLSSKTDLLAKGLGIDSGNVKLLLELLQSKKITKPELKFKAENSKLKVAGKKPFVYVEEEKGSFFFLGLDFPMMKKHIEPKLKAAEKALAKAKESEKEGLEAQKVFFEALFDRVKKKKLVATSGKIAVKEVDAETKECFMTLEGKVEGDQKSSLGEILKTVNFAAKNGEILRLFDPTASGASDTATSTTGEENEVDNKEKEAKKEKRAAQLTKMQEGIAKMDGAKDKVSKDKLDANIAKYEAALTKLIEEAKKDGIVDDDEQANIDNLEAALNALKEAVAQQSGQSDSAAKKMTPERRAKIKENMSKINARLEAITKKLGL